MISNLRPYPAYKDSGVPWLGQVPAHWEVRRLGASVTACINGVWGSDPDGYYDLPCVRVADFDRNRRRVRMIHPTVRSIPTKDRALRLLCQGDLLLEKSGGGDQQPVGMVVLYDHQVEAVCSNFIARMPVSEGYDPSFLNHLHATLYAIQLNVRSIKQTTGIQNLDSKAYLSELVAFPPLPEQTAIVRFLDSMDRRIRRSIRGKQKLIKLLEEYKQALIHQAVTGRIDVRTGKPYPAYKSSGVEWLGQVPEHWEVRKLRALFTKAGSGTTPSGEEFYGGDIPWVVTGDLNDSVLTNTSRAVNARAIETFSALRLYPKDSLIVAMYGATIGKTAILGIEACTNQACCVLAQPRKGVLVGFIQSVVISAKGFLVRQGYGGGQPNINSEIVHNLRIPVPPFDEQTSILAYLDAQTAKIDAAISAARSEIELLREYRERLIADVVTGKVDVREVASRLPEESEEPDLPEEEINSVTDESEEANETMSADEETED